MNQPSQWSVQFNSNNWKHVFAQTSDPLDPNAGTSSNPGAPNASTVRSQYNIQEGKLDWLNKKIEKLNRIARKLQLPPVSYRKLREEYIQDPNDELGMARIKMVTIEIQGNTPIITTNNGQKWEFIARILHTDQGNMIKSVPGAIPEGDQSLAPYRNVAPTCEHCNVRRNRKDTFLLRNPDTQEFKQVGSTCLKDFLGHMSANDYAWWAESLSDLGTALSADNIGDGGGGQNNISIESWLRLIYSICKNENGGRFVSRRQQQDAEARGQYGVQTTSNRATQLYYTRNTEEKEKLRQYLASLTPEDESLLEDALAWARGLKDNTEQSQMNDYLWNLSVACSQPIVTGKTMGIVAALPSTYERNVLQMQNVPAGGLVGAKGSEFAGKVTVESSRQYGDEIIYIAKTDDGRLVQWFGEDLGVPDGSPLFIKGTVMGVARVPGGSGTKLARVRLIDESQVQTMQQQQQTEQSPVAPAEYQEGQEIVAKVFVKKVDLEPDQYSRYPKDNFVYTMEDTSGTTLKWKTGRDFELEVGERITFEGEVKRIWQAPSGHKVVFVVSRKRNPIKAREFEGGSDNDKRMTPEELKALKKQISALDKQIKVLWSTIGFKNESEVTNAAMTLHESLSWIYTGNSFSDGPKAIYHFWKGITGKEALDAPAPGNENIQLDYSLRMNHAEWYLAQHPEMLDEVANQIEQGLQMQVQRTKQELMDESSFLALKNQMESFYVNDSYGGKRPPSMPSRWDKDYQEATARYEQFRPIREQFDKEQNKRMYNGRMATELERFSNEKGQLVGKSKQTISTIFPSLLKYIEIRSQIKQIEESRQPLEQRMGEHKDAVKMYGERTAFIHSWLRKAAQGLIH